MLCKAAAPGAALIAPAFLLCCLGAAPLAARVEAAAPLVDVRTLAPDIRVDLSYNRTANAFRRRFYHSNRALLRQPVAERLARVQKRLRQRGLGLKVWDAYRPRSVQYAMWRSAPRARSRYLANPRRGSKHNRGAAVDLTLVTVGGNELEMPTPHDEFSPRAHRGAARGVSPLARKNARMLEAAMRAEGFVPNPYEWWHYSVRDWRRYPESNAPIPQ